MVKYLTDTNRKHLWKITQPTHYFEDSLKEKKTGNLVAFPGQTALQHDWLF